MNIHIVSKNEYTYFELQKKKKTFFKGATMNLRKTKKNESLKT